MGVNIVNIRFQLMPAVLQTVQPGSFRREPETHTRCCLSSPELTPGMGVAGFAPAVEKNAPRAWLEDSEFLPDSGGQSPGILFKFELSATPVVHLGCTQCFSISHAVVPGGPAPGWADGRAGPGTGGGSNKKLLAVAGLRRAVGVPEIIQV